MRVRARVKVKCISTTFRKPGQVGITTALSPTDRSINPSRVLLVSFKPSHALPAFFFFFLFRFLSSICVIYRHLVASSRRGRSSFFTLVARVEASFASTMTLRKSRRVCVRILLRSISLITLECFLRFPPVLLCSFRRPFVSFFFPLLRLPVLVLFLINSSRLLLLSSNSRC